MVSEMQIGMITEVHMVSVVENSSEWWYDFGTTIHVCNNKTLFKEYVEAGNGLEVLMGNHNTVKVLGTGTVELILSSGKKLVLTNVYHVRDIKKNLVSASLLSKNGVKAVLESDKLILLRMVYLLVKIILVMTCINLILLLIRVMLIVLILWILLLYGMLD